MDAKLLIQKNGVNTLKEEFLKNSNKELKKIYVAIGGLKESGFDDIEEMLIDLKAKKTIILGIDKKYTTKRMLEGLYKYTKNIYVYNNNGMSELAINIFVFEYETRAEIYLMSGNVSNNLITEDRVFYTKLTYKLKDVYEKSLYVEYLDVLLNEIKQNEYIKLDKEYISCLSDTKEIFTTKQYVHNVMSISELLEKNQEEEKEKKTAKKEKVTDKVKIPKIDLAKMEGVDIDIEEELAKEIEMSSVEGFKVVEEKTSKIAKIKKTSKTPEKKSKTKENFDYENMDEESFNEKEFNPEEVLNIEDLLFEKADIRLNKKNVDKILKENKKKKEKETPPGAAANKKIDLAKVSNLVIELKSKPTKGRELTSIKIPNQIRKLIPSFFSTGTDLLSIKKTDGMYRESNVILEIIDIRENKKIKDMDAQISFKSGQNSISIVSEKLREVEYFEGDIARIIKLSEDTYHIEIVPKDIEEYVLWKKMCTQTVSGSDRQFGVM